MQDKFQTMSDQIIGRNILIMQSMVVWMLHAGQVQYECVGGKLYLCMLQLVMVKPYCVKWHNITLAVFPFSLFTHLAQEYAYYINCVTRI